MHISNLKNNSSSGSPGNNGVDVHANRHPRITRCILYMSRNYCRPIQLDEIVIASGMSRRGFMNAFKKSMGNSPGAVLRQMRIDHTKRLLEGENLKLIQIASLAGFRSVNTLCVAFNRATGMAPKQYQRRAWLARLRNLQRPRRIVLAATNPIVTLKATPEFRRQKRVKR